MLRALRTSAMALAFRRSIAALLVLCVCVAFIEPAVADACDNDAEAAKVATVRSVSESSSATVAAALAPASQITPAESQSSEPEGPTHALHVCHCVHAHVAPLGLRETLASAPAYPASVRVEKSDRTPPSVVQEPQLRPPRMPSVV